MKLQPQLNLKCNLKTSNCTKWYKTNETATSTEPQNKGRHPTFI
jgi:hypothetical protein